MTRVLTFDLGKTGCRAASWMDGERGPSAEVPGPPGLADPSGAAQAVDCVRRAAARLVPSEADTVVVGIAGLLSAPEQTPILLDHLAEWRPTARLVLTSDAVASHAGALSGRAGVVLAAGTGVAAIGVSADGTLDLVDGWGYLLGDAGSGVAIGRAGIDAALRHADGRGGSPELHRRAEMRWGRLRSLPSLLQGATNPAREIAAFATEVFAAAAQGEAVALGICDHAGRELAATIAAAVRRSETDLEQGVATVGGLLHAGDVLTAPLQRHLDQILPGARCRPPDGDALDGAHLLATRADLPHHRSPDAVITQEPR